jgi:hypothetical protein
MPIYNVQAPNGRTYNVEGPAGASQDEIIAHVMELDPAAGTPPTPATGLTGAFGAGLEQGVGESARGLGEVLGSQRLQQYGKEKETSAKTYTPISDEELSAAKTEGLFPEILAHVRKYGEEVAQTLGSVAGRYGLPTAAAFFAPEGVAAGLTFGGINAAVSTGSELAKQEDRGEQPDYLRATGFGLANAAIDQLTGHILHAPMRGVFGRTAAEEAMPLAKEVLAGNLTAQEASQQLSGTLRNVLLGTGQNAVVGTGMMVGHTMLERLEEGKSLTSPDAMEAYGNATIGAIGMAPIFGFMHGTGAREAAAKTLDSAEQTRNDLLAEQQKQKDALNKQQMDAYKQTDSYIVDLQDRAAQYGQQLAEFKKVAGAKVDPADPVAVAEKRKAQQDYANLVRSDEYKEFQRELQESVPRIREYQDRVTQESQKQKGYQEPLFTDKEQQELAAQPENQVPQTDLFGEPVQNYPREPEVAQAAAQEPAPVIDYHRQALLLEKQLEDLKAQATQTTDPRQILQLVSQHDQVEAALNKTKALAGKQAKPPEVQLVEAQKALDKAKELGDMKAAAKQAQRVIDLQEQGATQQPLDLGKPQALTQTPMPNIKSLQLTERAPEARESNQQRLNTVEEEEQLFNEQQAAAEAQHTKEIADIKHRTEPNQLEMFSPEEAPVTNAPQEPQATEVDPNADYGQQARALQQRSSDLKNLIKTVQGPRAQDPLIEQKRQIDEALSKAQGLAATNASPEERRAGLDLHTLDLFTPENMRNTDYQNLDPATRAKIEQQRLMETLGNLEGKRVTRAVIEDEDNKRMLRAGTHPNEYKQRIWDEQGEQAYDYQMVMDEIERIKAQINNPQGNAKRSLYNKLEDLAAEHESLLRSLEQGEPTPSQRSYTQRKLDTLKKGYDHIVNTYVNPAREKIAGLMRSLYTVEDVGIPTEIEKKNKDVKEIIAEAKQARTNKLRDIKAQYDEIKASLKELGPKEQADARKEMAKLKKEHDELAFAPDPLAPEVLDKTAPDKKEEITEAIKSYYDALERANQKPEMSRPAKRAQRMNAGETKYEVERTQDAINMAFELGTQEEEYKQAFAEVGRRLKALTDRYGADDAAVKEYKEDAGKDLMDLAIKLGKTTPEYKETVKQQMADYNRALQESGPLEPASKRTGQVTRKAVNAPRKLKTTLPGYTPPEETGLPTTYREEPRTDLSEENQNRLGKGDLMGVLADLAENSANPLIREKARMLMEDNKNTKVKIVSSLKYKGKSVPALYDPEINTIKFHMDGMNEEDLIHEATHAATARMLDTPAKDLSMYKRYARNELEALYNKLKADGVLTGEYAVRNLKEFAAELTSNQGLREKLDGVKWQGQSMLRRAMNAVMKFFGFNPRDALAAADHYVDKMRADSAAYRGGESASIFRKNTDYGTENGLTAFAKKIVAEPKSLRDRILPPNLALQAEMNAVDMRAPLREALQAGAKGINKPELFKQAMGHVIMNDEKVQFAMTSLSTGPLEIYRDAKGYYGVRSSNKNSGADVFKAMSAIPRGDAQAKVNQATAYMIAQRAANKGLKRLDLGALGIDQKDLDAAMAAADADPRLKAALEDVRVKYNAYNEGLLKFAADTGAIPKKVVAELLKDGDYVPYYRVDKNGQASLVFSDNVQIRVGDIRSQPYLDKLKGGETKILPLDQSIQQNTLLLTDKAMTTLAQKSVAYALQEIGRGRVPPDNDSLVIRKGDGPADPRVIHFQQEPDPNDPKDDGKRWMRVDTTGTLMDGIDPQLVVKSLEGTQLALPAGLKLMGAASDLLRSGVTRTPLYIAHQLLRDPIAATMTGGVQSNPFMAVMRAGKAYLGLMLNNNQTGKALIQKGIIQSGIFKGDKSDISKFALQLADGKDLNAIEKLVRFVDKAAMEADAATRTLVYEDAIKQGLSEFEADIATRESMNFHKRGLSSTVQYINRMIPFYNSQIQGLNVLAKAARGNMPYEEQLNIKRKFFNNAALLAMGGVAYGMAMADNDYYKNAKPYDRYTNMFVFLPGVAEPVKIPIPYEVGWFFALGTAAADSMRAEVRGEDQRRGLAKMFLNSVPGYGSQIGGLPVPQLFRPSAEVAMNKDFNTGNPIVSQRLAKLDPVQQYTENTTEVAKLFGQFTGVSPLVAEHLVRGYFGQIPLAAAAAAESLFKPAGTAPTPRASDTPFFGSAFQRRYGGGEKEAMYNIADESLQKDSALDNMINEGRREEAIAYRDKNLYEIQIAPLSKQYKSLVGKLESDRRFINARNMPADEKRMRLDKLDAAEEDIARRFKAAAEKIRVAGKTAPQ